MAEMFTIYPRSPVDVTSSVSVTRSFTDPVVVDIQYHVHVDDKNNDFKCPGDFKITGFVIQIIKKYHLQAMQPDVRAR